MSENRYLVFVTTTTVDVHDAAGNVVDTDTINRVWLTGDVDVSGSTLRIVPSPARAHWSVQTYDGSAGPARWTVEPLASEEVKEFGSVYAVDLGAARSKVARIYRKGGTGSVSLPEGEKWLTTSSATWSAMSDYEIPAIIVSEEAAEVPETRPSFIRPDGLKCVSRYITTLDRPEPVSEVDYLRELRKDREHLLIVGEPGVGKTFVIESSFYGEFLQVMGDPMLDESAFLGTYEEKEDSALGATFVEGPLITAMRNGWVLFIDEALRISNNAMTSVYNAMVPGGYVTIPGKPSLGKIYPAEGFMVVLAGNPRSRGAFIDDAMLSRCSEKWEWTSDFDILVAELGADPRAVLYARLMNKLFDAGLLENAPQTREVMAFTRVLKRGGLQHAVKNILGGVQEIDLERAVAQAKIAFGTSLSIEDAKLRL